MHDKDGNPMPEDMARLAAYAGGLMNSGIEVWEYMGLGKIAGAGATLEAIKELLKDPKNYQAIADGAVKAGKALGIDSLQTLGATAAQHSYSGLIKGVSDSKSGTNFAPRPSVGGVMDTLEDAGKKIVLGNIKKGIVR